MMVAKMFLANYFNNANTALYRDYTENCKKSWRKLGPPLGGGGGGTKKVNPWRKGCLSFQHQPAVKQSQIYTTTKLKLYRLSLQTLFVLFPPFFSALTNSSHLILSIVRILSSRPFFILFSNSICIKMKKPDTYTTKFCAALVPAAQFTFFASHRNDLPTLIANNTRD